MSNRVLGHRNATIAGILMWGACCACIWTTRTMVFHHLDFVRIRDLASGLALRTVCFSIALMGLVWVAGKVRTLGNLREEVVATAGFFTAFNLIVVGAIEFLNYTSLGLPLWIEWGAALGANALLAGVLRFGWRLLRRPMRVGWSLQFVGFPMAATVFVFYVHHALWLSSGRFSLAVVMPFLFVGCFGFVLSGVFWRRPQLIALVVYLGIGVLSATGFGAAAGEWLHGRKFQKNADGGIQKVILLTVDTLRYDMIMRPEGAEELAPNLRRLIDGGILFENAVSPAPWTLTSFCSMLTGLEPLVHGRTRDARTVPPEAYTLAERFQDHDFLTRAVLCNFNLDPTYRLDQGFEEYIFADADYVEDSLRPELRKVFGEDFRIEFPGDATGEITRAADEWLRSMRDQRYFLWIHYLDPHLPYSPPGEFVAGQATAEFGGRFDAPRDEWAAPGFFSPERRKWMRELYEGEVRYVDESVGKLLKTLRETGQDDETLIIFTSDHGEEFWDHDGYEHGHTLFQELLHVPLAIVGPKVESGRKESARVAVPQLFSTILDLCGFENGPDELDYPSLRPLWGDDAGTTEGIPARIWSGNVLYGEPQRALIEGNMKLVLKGEKEVELYDLGSDPGEKTNLARTHDEDVRNMMRRLIEHEAQAAKKKASLGFESKGEDEPMSPRMIEGLKDLGYM